MVKSTERPRRAPVGRASERQKRSDLICDRKTSYPPASSPSPLYPSRRISTTFESTSCTLRLLASLALLPSLPPRSSPVFRCSWASSRAEFISPVKYSRPRLPSLHLYFFLFLFTSNFFRSQLLFCLYQSLWFPQFIIRVPSVMRSPSTSSDSSSFLHFSRLFSSLLYSYLHSRYKPLLELTTCYNRYLLCL